MRVRKKPEGVIVGYTNRRKGDKINFSNEEVQPHALPRKRPSTVNQILSGINKRKGYLNQDIKSLDNPPQYKNSSNLYKKSGLNNILSVFMKNENFRYPIFQARNRLMK
mmetsp:Transcript_16429/g.14348  ORF Transcript_16429/g.14348 Transcript_16429/m.14348 type:complete len:109 (-) Transcript_16429:350-676(-)